MRNRLDRIARGIQAFLENPYTNLFKGAALFVIGLSEASRTLSDDVAHAHLRVGHGLIIIGLFGMLDTIPKFLEGLEASKRYLDLRSKATHAEPVSPGAIGPGEARSE